MKKALFCLLTTLMLVPAMVMAQKPTKAGTVVVEEATACDTYTWERNSVEYDASGVYQHTIDDTTYVLNLTVGYSTDETISPDASCDYSWQGETFTTDTTVVKTLQSIYGCDSTVTLSLNLSKAYRDTLEKITCMDFTFRGETYGENGVYSDTVRNEELSCDSIFSVDLTITSTISRELNEVNACSRYTWALNNDSVYTASTTDSVLIESTDATQCDTLYSLTINIGEAAVDSSFITMCRQFTWERNDSTYTESTIDSFTQRAETDDQCDTIFVLDLTVIETMPFETVDSVCGAFTWQVNDSTYTESTTDEILRQHNDETFECDSLFTLDITIFEKNDTVNARVCDMYTYVRHYGDSTANDTALVSGEYFDTIIDNNKCVTNRVYNLDITPTRIDSTVIDTARCRTLSLFFTRSGRQSLNVNGSERRADERITITRDQSVVVARYASNTAPQCFDSIITVNITINKISYDTRTPEVKDGCGEYKWNTTRRKMVDSTHFGGLDSIVITENIVDALHYVIVDEDTLKAIYLTTDTTLAETDAATLNADTIIVLNVNSDMLATETAETSTDTTLTTIDALHLAINDTVNVYITSDTTATNNEGEQLLVVATKLDTVLNRVGGIDTLIEVFDSVHRTYTRSTRDSVEVGVNEFGCDEYHLIKVNIYSNPIVSISGDFKVQSRDDVAEIYAVVDSAENIAKYEWSGNYTLDSSSAKNDSIWIKGMSANTDVTLKITDKHNCSAESWITILYGVGIADVDNVNLSIYPNPTAQIINLKADNNMSRMAIYNTVGVQMIQKDINGSQQTIDLSTLPQGAYTMRIEMTNGQTITRRFIKSK